MNGLNVLGFSSTGFDWWLYRKIPSTEAVFLTKKSAENISVFVSRQNTVHPHFVQQIKELSSDCEVTEAESCQKMTHVSSPKHLHIQASGSTGKKLLGVGKKQQLKAVLSCFWQQNGGKLFTKGRDNLPSRQCWRAKRMWEKRLWSMRPVQVDLCGAVLSSTHLLCTPQSSRRSSGSLFRPNTRTHKCPRSPASTGSCLTRWWCVEEVSHSGRSSSGKKKIFL